MLLQDPYDGQRAAGLRQGLARPVLHDGPAGRRCQRGVAQRPRGRPGRGRRRRERRHRHRDGGRQERGQHSGQPGPGQRHRAQIRILHLVDVAQDGRLRAQPDLPQIPPAGRPEAAPAQFARPVPGVVVLTAPGVVEKQAVRGGGGPLASGTGGELPPEAGAFAQPGEVQQTAEHHGPGQVRVPAGEEGVEVRPGLRRAHGGQADGLEVAPGPFGVERAVPGGVAPAERRPAPGAVAGDPGVRRGTQQAGLGRPEVVVAVAVADARPGEEVGQRAGGAVLVLPPLPFVPAHDSADSADAADVSSRRASRRWAWPR